MSCSICCNKSKTLVSCPHCSHEACTTCLQKYLLSQPEDTCMSCHKAWALEFISQKFSKSFVTFKLTKHHTKMFIEHQKTLFPETLLYIENEKLERKLNDDSYYLERLERILYDINSQEKREEDFINYPRKHARSLILFIDDDEFCEGFMLLSSWTEAREFVWDKMKSIMAINDLLKKKLQAETQHRCGTEKCIGYLRNQPSNPLELKCNVCKIVQCFSCLGIILTSSSPHICDQDIVETIKLLSVQEKEIKQCPQCKIHIQKNDGCDQMFCTKCQCAFDWSTNQVITGRVHNPHYFEWIAKGGVRPEEQLQQEQGCPSLPVSLYRQMTSLVHSKFALHASATTTPTNLLYFRLLTMFQIGSELVAAEGEQRIDTEEVFRSLRIEVLSGEITELLWEKQVHWCRLQNLQRHNLYQLNAGFGLLLTNVYQDFVQQLLLISPHNNDLIYSTLQKTYTVILELVDYYNDHYIKIKPFSPLVTKVEKILIPFSPVLASTFKLQAVSKDEYEFKYFLDSDIFNTIFYTDDIYELALCPKELYLLDSLRNVTERMNVMTLEMENACNLFTPNLVHLYIAKVPEFEAILNESCATLSNSTYFLEYVSELLESFNGKRTLIITEMKDCYIYRHINFKEKVVEYAEEFGKFKVFSAQQEELVAKYSEFLTPTKNLKKYKTVTNKYKSKLGTYTSVKTIVDSLSTHTNTFYVNACYAIFIALKNNPYFPHFPLQTFTHKQIEFQTFPWMICDLQLCAADRISLVYYRPELFNCVMNGAALHTPVEYLLMPALILETEWTEEQLKITKCFRMLLSQYKITKWSNVDFVHPTLMVQLIRHTSGTQLPKKWIVVFDKAKEWLKTQGLFPITYTYSLKLNASFLYFCLSILIQMKVVTATECKGLLNNHDNIIPIVIP